MILVLTDFKQVKVGALNGLKNLFYPQSDPKMQTSIERSIDEHFIYEWCYPG